VSRILALSLATVILAILLATPHIGTQAQDEVEVKIRWTRYIDPTDGKDAAHGTCVFDKYIAVVGEANWTPPYVPTGRPYVVLLHKSDGVVAGEWSGSEVGAFINCISIDRKLYAIGATSVNESPYGVIYVFDVNLNILAKIRSENPSGYFSLTYNNGVLYLGGWAYEDVDGDDRREIVGLVEKRVLNVSILPVESRKIYFGSWMRGWIFDIGVDPSTGRIWAVGLYEDLDNKTHSLIMILDDDLRVFKIIDYPEGSEGYLDWLYGIAFDGRYAYVSGDEGVAKFSADGELVAINKDGKARDKIVYDYNYLYTFGEDRIRGYWRHVLYIHDANLNIVKGYVLSENINATSYFYIGRPVLEGNSIYVAGIDYALGSENSRIVVYSLSIIEIVTVTTTTTVTTTVATTTTRTTTVTTTVSTTTTTTTTRTATTTVTTTVPTTTTAAITVPTTTTTTMTTAIPTTTTVTATIPLMRNVTVTTIATAYTTILATTTIPILSTVTETLERTATVERVVERSITVEKPVTATQTLTKAQTTILDRMTTPAIIGLVAAGTLLAITTLILRR